MAAERRVVITGWGLISPLGNSADALWQSLSTGKSGIRAAVSVPDEYLPIPGVGECWDFTTDDIEAFGPLEKNQKRTIKKNLKVACREIQMGVACAQLALFDANLAQGGFDPDRTGVVYGSDYMMTAPEELADSVRICLDEDNEFQYNRFGDQGLKKIDPLWLLKYLPNMPASHVAIYNDMRGPNNSITTREASSNLAVAEAFCTIQRGNADIIIAGATGTRVHPLRSIHMTMQEEIASGRSPEQLCRPFDKDRNGMVIGEGAAAIVLEELETAKKRGAKILGEIVGYGSSSVVGKNTVAHYGKALFNVMRQALSTSGMKADDVGHVHAHGVSTRKGDLQEAAAINEMFGGRSKPVPVTALKSYMGNLGAGAGLIELISSVLAIEHGKLFPVMNYDTPDPECAINVNRSFETSPGQSVLNMNVTPQGQASAILAKAFEG